MTLHDHARACRARTFVPVLPILLLSAWAVPAGAHAVEGLTGAGDGNGGEPCATAFLKPPPCPLWYWTAIVRGPVEEAHPRVSRNVEGYAGSHTVGSAVVIATSLAAATFLDVQLRRVLAADNPDQPATLANVGNTMGNGRLIFMATSATYGLSRLAGYDDLADPASRVVVVLLMAGVANGALKAGIGRGRPRLEVGSSEFRPFAFNDNDWQSFPSGHAVTAFALATAIAAETDATWVSALSYGAAGLVAWSRSHEDRHWASDVMGGAAVGTIVAHYTTRHLSRRAGKSRNLEGARLLVGPATLGVSLPIH